MQDYFIIGQGLAGSVLALKLLEQGKRIHVFESPQPNTSSTIAAGLMNPVTGKRMTVSWRADEMFPIASRFYQKQESLLNTSFFYPMPVYRVFSSVGEQNDWTAKMHESRYSRFISPDAIEALDATQFRNPFGGLKVTGGGRLDVPQLMDATRKRLLEEGCFSLRHISAEDIQTIGEGYSIGEHQARRVVFCTGVDMDNWGFLPFTPMKGEVLEVEAPQHDREKIVVGGCFFSPKTNGNFYVGATYDWRNLNLVRTEKAKLELLERLGRFVEGNPKVVDHRVGVRPAVKDRRPMLGQHPEMKGYYLLGGFGSKGVSMAPYLADCLIAHMEHGQELDVELNLRRFL